MGQSVTFSNQPELADDVAWLREHADVLEPRREPDDVPTHEHGPDCQKRVYWSHAACSCRVIRSRGWAARLHEIANRIEALASEKVDG